MYEVVLRPVMIDGRIYKPGQKVEGNGKEVEELLKQGYLKPIRKDRDGKAAKK